MSPSEPEPASADADVELVKAVVREEAGEWFVDIAVITPEGVERHVVNKYRSKQHAAVAASWIERGANRDVEGPTNG